MFSVESTAADVKLKVREGDPKVHLIAPTPNAEDETTEEFISSLKEHNAILPTILLPESSGPGFNVPKSVNVGLKYSLQANPDFIILSNNDIKFESDVIGTLIDQVKRHEEVGYFVPMVRMPPKLEPTMVCTVMPKRGSMALVVNFLNYMPKFVIRWAGGLRNERSTHMQDGAVQQLIESKGADFDAVPKGFIISSAPFIVMRTETFRKVGLLDERFFNGLDDFDFTLRVYSMGLKVGVDTHAVLTHLISQSGGFEWAHTFPAKSQRMIMNWKLMYSKYPRKKYNSILDLARRNNLII